MTKHHIVSTMTSSVEYVEWKAGGSDLPEKGRVVVIKGGAGVADKKTIITPTGVVTTVSDEDLTLLRSNKVFQMHERNGFITVHEQRRAPEVETVVPDMAQRDASAPATTKSLQAKSGGAKLQGT